MARRSGIPDSVTFHHFGASPTPSGKHIMLVPGAAVPLVPVDLPKGLTGQAREQAARLHLGDVTGLVPGSFEAHPVGHGAAGWNQMLLADQAALVDWRAAARAAGASCRAILPDYLALPAAEGIWVIESLAEMVCVRMGLDDGFSAEPALAEALLGDALQAAETPPSAVLFIGNAAPQPLPDLFKAHDIPLLESAEAAKALDLPMPQILQHGELTRDLSRNPEVALAEMRRRVVPLAWAVVLAVVAAVIYGASLTTDTNRVRAAELVMRSDTQEVLRQSLVPSGPILDVRAQATAALAALADPDATAPATLDPLTALRRVGPILLTQNATLQSVEFTPANGLDLQISLASFAALDQLVDILETDGFQVVVRDSGARDSSGIDASLRLQERSP